ncbi:hypothetical protein ACI78Q_17040 [Geodermatophilus sp. SYSU D00705]
MSSWGWVLLAWPLPASLFAVLVGRGLAVADRHEAGRQRLWWECDARCGHGPSSPQHALSYDSASRPGSAVA